MTNLGDRYGDQSVIVESAAGAWVQGSRRDDGAPVIGLALAGAAAQKADEAAAAARAVDSKQCPFVAPLAEATAGALVWGPAGAKRLADVVKQRGGLPLDRVVDLARQIGLALVAAEEAGVPHHDLSPRTIAILDAGDTGMVARVAGFGAAKLVPLYSTARKNDPFHGTPEYMAPEVCGGKGADHRSDIYALGIIMYEMVTVKPPFLSNNINTTIKRQIYEKPLPLHLVKPGVEHISELEKIVLRAVEKDPKKRFQTAADLVAALETLRNDLFPSLVFSDPAQVVARVGEQAAAPAEGSGDFIPAAAEDITSRKHGTLVFSGLGQALDLDDEAAPKPAAEAQPKPGTQVFAGLGDLLDEEEEDDDDARAHPTLVGVPAMAAPEAKPEPAPEPERAPEPEPEPEGDRTLVSIPAMTEPAPRERTVELVEQEPARHATVVFDPREGLDLRPEAATAAPVTEDAEEADDAVEKAPEEPAPKHTMLFEAVKDVPEEPAKEEPAAEAAPPSEPAKGAAPSKGEDPKHAEMVSWAASQPPRERAKSEEMEAWFAEGSPDAVEPEDPFSIAEGKRSTRKFMIVMGAVTVVLVVLVAVFMNSGEEPEKGRKSGSGAKIEQGGPAAGATPAPPQPEVAGPTADQAQAASLVELGDQALERDDALGAKVLYEQALKKDPENDAARTGLEKASALLAAQAAPPVAADAGAQPEAADGSAGGAGTLEATAEEAAAAKAAEEAAAAKAAEEAAAAKAAEEAAAAKAAEEAAAAKAAEEAAAAKTAEASAAKAAEEAAAAKAAEEAAAKKAAEEAAAKKAAEEAAAKKAAEEAAAKKAAEGSAKKTTAEDEAAKKAAAEAAAKKAAEKAAAKKAAEEAAAAKAAEKAAAKKAAEEAAAKKAAEEAAAKKAAGGGSDSVKASPEEEAKKLVKLGIGAMKAGNNALALKYFNKAKNLNPGDKYIQQYIEKASQ